jgi:hypothetical protein
MVRKLQAEETSKYLRLKAKMRKLRRMSLTGDPETKAYHSYQNVLVLLG